MELGNRIYELRKKKGMSQEALADKLNVTRQTISKWELSESTPDLEKLVAIHDLFQVSLDELVLEAQEDSNESTAYINQDNDNIDSKSNATDKLVAEVFNKENGHKAKRILKILIFMLAGVFVIDIISLIVYFAINGVPK